MSHTRRNCALTMLAMLLVACTAGEAAPPPTTTATSTTMAQAPVTTVTTPPTTLPATTTTSTTVVPTFQVPLTGEMIEDPSLIPDRAALIVKIPNNPAALPQAGLNQADIVFEEIINDHITRFAAVFHSQGTGSNPIGPIRSGRAQDLNIALAFNRPLFAWSGGNPAVTKAIEKSDLVDLSANYTSGYYRRSGRNGSPHNLFSSTDALWAQAPDVEQRPSPVFTYSTPGEVLTGEPASVIELTLDSIDVRWEYDAASGRYLRWQNGKSHDTEDDGQIWADNVVVFVADYTKNALDGNPDAMALGSNTVYIFSDGIVRVGVWMRSHATDPFLFFNNASDLVTMPVSPGRTWVEVPRNIAGVVKFR